MENDKVLKRLRNMIAYVPVATIAFDAELRVLEWNEAAGRLFGVATQNAIGRSVADFFIAATDSGPSAWRDLVDRQEAAEVTATGRMTDGLLFRRISFVCSSPLHVRARNMFFMSRTPDIANAKSRRCEKRTRRSSGRIC